MRPEEFTEQEIAAPRYGLQKIIYNAEEPGELLLNWL